LLLFKRSEGAAAPTLALLHELETTGAKVDASLDSPHRNHNGFTGSIQIENLSFSYPGSREEATKNLSIQMSPGSTIAIVGPSGAGKTTFADLILGLLQPLQGKALISGLPPEQVIKKWPGAIAYVPQETLIINGSVKDNICLGFKSELVSDELIWEALKAAKLDDFVSQLPKKLDSDVGELGSKFSGGQRQRLGIARALLTSPGLVILDEATSSLDGKTESDVTESILKLKGSVTLIFIAHRLSTVREADLVIYLDKGEIKASGTFNDVRKAIPDFDNQAKLMGL
jgi:ABC-type multidrug transport system fused ATPase/permease subunit